MKKKFYKILNEWGWVLSNTYSLAGEKVLGYGGVWCKDHRKAKRFKTLKECQKEVNKMPYPNGTKFLVITNNEDWKNEYQKFKNKLKF